MKRFGIALIAFAFWAVSCANDTGASKDSFVFPRQPIEIGDLERKMIAAGLTNVREVDSSIVVRLMYSTTNNFLHCDIYGDLTDCFLIPKAAGMLAEAQRRLKSIRPDYSLIVYDGARPLSAQWKMWKLVKGTAQQQFVADPRSGSIHNYAAAVDVSIVDARTNTLDMGCEYDTFGELAMPSRESELYTMGRIGSNQLANRRLLRRVMTNAGFGFIGNEWWHFNALTKEQAVKSCAIVE